MTEELFDIVDERDGVIDLRPRSEAHRLGLRHRAVHVLVFNAAGELFLQKRSMSKDCHPGVWDSSASGHLAPGEPYEAGALRELGEEIGLAPPGPLEPLFKLDACEITGMEFCWVYRARHDGPVTLDPVEVDDGAWVAPDEIDRRALASPGDFAPAFILIWETLRSLDAIAMNRA